MGLAARQDPFKAVIVKHFHYLRQFYDKVYDINYLNIQTSFFRLTRLFPHDIINTVKERRKNYGDHIKFKRNRGLC